MSEAYPNYLRLGLDSALGLLNTNPYAQAQQQQLGQYLGMQQTQSWAGTQSWAYAHMQAQRIQAADVTQNEELLLLLED